jgi:hypothetical protein
MVTRLSNSAALVLAGLVAYNVLYAGTLAEKVSNARGVLTDEVPTGIEVFLRVWQIMGE